MWKLPPPHDGRDKFGSTAGDAPRIIKGTLMGQIDYSLRLCYPESLFVA